jgi:GNAT superfamily N-acetyltransferase
VVLDDLIIRSAVQSDVPQIIGMDNVARAPMDIQRGGPEWLFEHLAVALWTVEEILARTLVAEYAGAIVGFLVYQMADQPGRGLICTVDRVFVEEPAREMGCGDGLLALATEIAAQARCSSIEGNALPGDRETKNLYERASMKARKIITSRDL